MDANYWDELAQTYDDAVTDAFTHGRNKTVTGAIERFASPAVDVADFGCGPGKLLPFLSTRFRRVYGYDFSQKLLDIARERCQALSNVEVAHADLSQPVNHLPMVDLAVSLNAAIMPDAELRDHFLAGMASRIRPGGHLVMNVPSVESTLYVAFRETQWHRSLGLSFREAELETDTSCLTEPQLMAQGALNRGDELTKHYLREELIVLVRDLMKLEPLEVTKMEYSWATEFETDEIPPWMQEPFPWDWLVVAKAPRPA
jgi:SAM-dependent methyltransferase